MLLLSIAINNISNAQCLSGNCKTGKGKFDFGWCKYEGDFVNEKADGNGIMIYDDFTYTGSFKNGVEDGKGIITYKNGKKEEVTYANGKKLDNKPIALKEDEYKPLKGVDMYCKTGNCDTGYGTYAYESGNVYIGNFVNFKMQGKGIFYFLNGDLFEGTFNEGLKVNGTYTYKVGGYYVGNYDAAGKELNGSMYFNNRRIAISNGKPIIVKSEVTAEDVAKSEAQIRNAESKKRYEEYKNSQWQYPKTTYGSESSDTKMYRDMHQSQDRAVQASNNKWLNYTK